MKARNFFKKGVKWMAYFLEWDCGLRLASALDGSDNIGYCAGLFQCALGVGPLLLGSRSTLCDGWILLIQLVLIMR
jgi:hypothetical protein